jgi:hypothetical protein
MLVYSKQYVVLVGTLLSGTTENNAHTKSILMNNWKERNPVVAAVIQASSLLQQSKLISAVDLLFITHFLLIFFRCCDGDENANDERENNPSKR